MPVNKHVNPLISWSVLIVGLLSAITFAAVYIILQKTEAARDKLLVEQYRKMSVQFTNASLYTNLGRISISFFTKDAPITLRNFTRVAGTGIFDNTLLQLDAQTQILVSGRSAQEIDSTVIDRVLGRGKNLNDKFSPNIMRGMVAIKFEKDQGRPVLAFVTEDGMKLPPEFHVFGTISRGLEYIDAAYQNEKTGTENDLYVVIRRVEVGEEI